MRKTNTIARLTGLGYLVIFISGFFANFFILEGLVVEGDIASTTINFQNNIEAFQRGLLSFGIMVAVDILLALPLYVLLNDTHRRLAQFSSWIRLINGTVFGLALMRLTEISGLFDYPSIMRNASPGELQESVMTILNSFEATWDFALILFGIHLVILGYLLVRSASFPRWIGYLITLAGLTYMADSTVRLVRGEGQAIGEILEVSVLAAGILGEFSLTLFLLFKGVSKRTRLQLQPN